MKEALDSAEKAPQLIMEVQSEPQIPPKKAEITQSVISASTHSKLPTLRAHTKAENCKISFFPIL